MKLLNTAHIIERWKRTSTISILIDTQEDNGRHILVYKATSSSGLDFGHCDSVKSEMIDPCKLNDDQTGDDQEGYCFDEKSHDSSFNFRMNGIKIEPSIFIESNLSTNEINESFEMDNSGMYSGLQTTNHVCNRGRRKWEEDVQESTCISTEVLNKVSNINQEPYNFIEHDNIDFECNAQYRYQAEYQNTYPVSPNWTMNTKQMHIIQIKHEPTINSNLPSTHEVTDLSRGNTAADYTKQYFAEFEQQKASLIFEKSSDYFSCSCNDIVDDYSGSTDQNMTHLQTNRIPKSLYTGDNVITQTVANPYRCNLCNYATDTLRSEMSLWFDTQRGDNLFM